MKSLRFLFALLLGIAVFAGGYAYARWVLGKAPKAGKRILYYVDPMHLGYTSDKPGIAPDCGMRLEPVNENVHQLESRRRKDRHRRGRSLASASAAELSPVLSKKEVKTLIQTAKTPEDHMKLARYFHNEANQLQAEAKDHDQMSTEYFRVPGSRPTLKYPTMGAHCRDLSAYYSQAAKKAEEMAALDEEMAKGAGK